MFAVVTHSRVPTPSSLHGSILTATQPHPAPPSPLFLNPQPPPRPITPFLSPTSAVVLSLDANYPSFRAEDFPFFLA